MAFFHPKSKSMMIVLVLREPEQVSRQQKRLAFRKSSTHRGGKGKCVVGGTRRLDTILVSNPLESCLS